MQRDAAFEAVEPIPGAPALFERETGQSYLGRLVAHFGYQSINEFCGDFGLDQRGIQWGKEPALRHLAALTNANAADLVRWTPVRIDFNHHRLGDVEFMTDIGARSHIRQCPVCAREAIASNPDLAPELCLYGRAEWATGFSQVCHTHHVKLVKRTTFPCIIERADPAYTRTGIFEELDFIEDEPAEPTSFERYAIAVILDQTAGLPPFPATLSLDSMLRLCRALGADIAANLGNNDVDERQACALGFEAIAGGPDGLLQTFRAMRNRRSARYKAQNMVPNLLRCIARTPRQDMIQFRAIVVDLLFRTFPARPGSKLLGIPCTKRHVHTFTSARLEYKITRELLHLFALHTPGLATRPAEKRTDILIDKATADALFPGRTPFRTAGQLKDYFGRNPHEPSGYLNLLIEAGILGGPLQDEPLLGHAPVFSLPQVEQEVASFLAPFPRVHAPPEKLIPLRIAVARTKISLVGLLTLLAQRKLVKVAVLKDAPVMDSLLVDRDEILQILTGDPAPLTKNQAHAYLGINGMAVTALVREGWLRPVQAQLPGIKCNLADLLPTAELDAFKARYLRLRDTCDITGGRSYSHLKSIGLEPAIFIDLHKKDQGRVIFYDRADVERFRKRPAA